MNVRSARLAPAGGNGKLAWRTANTTLWVRIGSSAALNSATSTRLPLSLSRSRTVTRPRSRWGGHGLAQGANDAAREVVVLARAGDAGRAGDGSAEPTRRHREVGHAELQGVLSLGLRLGLALGCGRRRGGALFSGLSLAGVSLGAASSAGRGDGFSCSTGRTAASFGLGSGFGSDLDGSGASDGGGGSLCGLVGRGRRGDAAGHAGRGRVEGHRGLALEVGGIDDHDADAVGLAGPLAHDARRGRDETDDEGGMYSAAQPRRVRTGAARRDARRASGARPLARDLASALSTRCSCHQPGWSQTPPPCP